MTASESTPFARSVHAILWNRLRPYTIDLMGPDGSTRRGAQVWVIDGPSVVSVAVNLDGHRTWNEALGFAQRIVAILDDHNLEHSVVDLVINVFSEK